MRNRQQQYDRYVKPLLQQLEGENLLTPELQQRIDQDDFFGQSEKMAIHLKFLIDQEVHLSSALINLFTTLAEKECNLGKLRNLFESMHNKKILSEGNLLRMHAYLPFGGEQLVRAISNSLKKPYDGRSHQAHFDNALNGLRQQQFDLIFKAARCLLLSDHFPLGLSVHMLKEMNKGFEAVVQLEPLVATVLAKRDGIFAVRPQAQADADASLPAQRSNPF